MGPPQRLPDQPGRARDGGMKLPQRLRKFGAVVRKRQLEPMQAMRSHTYMPLAGGLSSRARIGQGFPQVCSPARMKLTRRIAASKLPMAFKEDEAEETKQAGLEFPSSSTSQVPYQAGRGAVEVFKVEDPVLRVIPAFTRRREHMVGRVAMLGMAACWYGEVLTGMGPMGQLGSELNVPISWAFWTTAFLAMGHLLMGLSKGSPTFFDANRRDLAYRSKGLVGLTGIPGVDPDTSSRISLTETPGKFFLRSELVLGRLAMLLFAGAMLLEFVWAGESPLAHFGLIATGVPLAQAPGWLKLSMGLFTLGGLGLFSGFGGNKDPDTY